MNESKKTMLRAFGLILAALNVLLAVLLWILRGTVAGPTEDPSCLTALYEKDLTSFVDQDANIGHIYEIAQIKRLEGMEGGVYSVVELDPRGYMIYDLEAQTCLEYSLYDFSPYEGLTENLYYGGDGQFYAEIDGQWTVLTPAS